MEAMFVNAYTFSLFTVVQNSAITITYLIVGTLFFPIPFLIIIILTLKDLNILCVRNRNCRGKPLTEIGF